MAAQSYRLPKKMDQDLTDLEAYLKTTLTPVVPRPGFVDGLSHKLAVERADSPQTISIFQSTLIVLAVGLGGIVLLISLVRIMVVFIHTFHGTRHWNGVESPPAI